MIIEIDKQSGFCHGVVRAIRKAEQELQADGTLYCLGDIVHNGQEMQRLSRQGLKTISYSTFSQLKGIKVLLRAHGEPPSTYLTAKRNGISIIDASCRVVLTLQEKIRKSFELYPEAQIVIYGKHGHAEVLGLEGQTDNTAVVVENEEELNKVDFTRDIILFAQTTQSIEGFRSLVELIKQRHKGSAMFKYYDTICRQVSNRIPEIRIFASRFDVTLFVGGEKSSNGRILFQECLKVNPHTHFISSGEDIDERWFAGCRSVGICGATSTPEWLMIVIKDRLEAMFN
ncbi:MAG: 4-hydroxy-3-methylbut-2-enyl diphosphate reductase [Prevotellaceae bacterium]|jgi:4-hydroxy-3-methylbut-2-enyl diphosphate reductase|nr:4-hydroxy-3-methylbut-2-enyl diphosphate reductase [Prevotellaceae bacterium]